MKSIFEEMGGTYTLGADGMYYPDLALSEEEPHYGKYGRMRLRHLKEHRKVLYNTLLLDGELIKLHTAVASGRWCGGQWPQCGLSGHHESAH